MKNLKVTFVEVEGEMPGNMKTKDVVVSVFSTVFKIVVAIVIVMLVYKWSMSAYEYGQRVFNEPPVSVGEGRIVTVTVNQGDTVKKISKMLEEAGLIRDAELFMIQEMLSEYKDKMKPGTYALSTSMTTEEMMQIMSKGVEEE